MGFADLHIHTEYSFDGTASVLAVLQQAKQTGLDVIAITDHDEIDGALEAMELAPEVGIEVIPGIEVSTADGDLLALNVTQKIERDQPMLETLSKVGKLGGICIAPHPMDDGYRMHSLGSYLIMKALRDRDAAKILIAIETYNATILNKANNDYARILAEHLGIAQTGNSDAHVLNAIGLGRTKFPGHTRKELLTALQNGLTVPWKDEEWNAVQILGSWVVNFYGNKLVHLKENTREKINIFAT
jgi:predicted metal-dependent phosphoesterase TrpH